MKKLFKLFRINKRERKSLKQLQQETVYKEELIDFNRPMFWMATEQVR